MAQTFTLAVEPRTRIGKSLKTSRKQGLIPAVLYGHDIAPATYFIPALPFARLYEEAGESTVIEVKPTKGKAVNALIHDVQHDPITGAVAHVDLYQVRMDEEIETGIELEFTGEAPAIRESGGVLVKTLEEIQVKCLPKDLPASVIVDLSVLKTFDDQIRVRDLPIGTGVAVLIDPETMVAFVEAPRSDAEMAALDEKVEMDVTKVEGVVKEPTASAAEPVEEKK
jgi:large subunit ribosomal protein L25